MKRLLAVMLCLAMIAGIGAAWAEADPEISPEAAKVNAFGIPNVEDIANLKAEADALWENEDYSGAAEAYEELSQQAGWMVEIIAAVNMPSDLEDEKALAGNMAESVAKADALRKEYREIKKLANIRAGLGYYYNNDYDSALPYLMQALYMIDASDTENWTLCAQAVLVIVGVAEPPED